MSAFVAAEWRQIVMLNFVADPEVLKPLVPRGTELDLWNGRTYLSVVGFLFLGTKVWGVPVPFHSRFEEVNLHFYVKRRMPAGGRRGVAFVREFVPKRSLYGEPYTACPTEHRIEVGQGDPGLVEYRGRLAGRWNCVRVESLGPSTELAPGSEEEFIAEHYWGYTAVDATTSREYEVRHPPWRIRHAESGTLECNVAEVYGSRFATALDGEPTSAFLAEGSRVPVHRGRVIPGTAEHETAGRRDDR
jgi:uncharacterized protein YqjF (DUF2071 family)